MKPRGARTLRAAFTLCERLRRGREDRPPTERSRPAQERGRPVQDPAGADSEHEEAAVQMPSHKTANSDLDKSAPTDSGVAGVKTSRSQGVNAARKVRAPQGLADHRSVTLALMGVRPTAENTRLRALDLGPDAVSQALRCGR